MNPIKFLEMIFWISTHIGFDTLWHDYLEHPGRDIYWKPHTHLFYQNNRSKNQKMIQEGETCITDMPKNRAIFVKHPTIIRVSNGDRSDVSKMPWRPIDDHINWSTAYRTLRWPVAALNDRSHDINFRSPFFMTKSYLILIPVLIRMPPILLQPLWPVTHSANPIH